MLSCWAETVALPSAVQHALTDIPGGWTNLGLALHLPDTFGPFVLLQQVNFGSVNSSKGGLQSPSPEPPSQTEYKF